MHFGQRVDFNCSVVPFAPEYRWFAHGWYLNTRLRSVHKKLDQILEQFNGAAGLSI
jgi:hypothetical protein